MSRQIMYSLIGMEKINSHLWDDFTWPQTFTNDDKETFKVELLSETAELELGYTDSVVMQLMMKAWSRRRAPIWDHLIETTKYDYDPIKNWDRDEHTLDTETLNTTKTTDMTNQRDGDSTDTLDVAGFDSSTLVPREKSTIDSSNTTTDTGTIKDTGTVTHEITHKASGNVGTLTTQAMIKEEREIAEFDIISIMVSDFKERFCLLIY